MIEYLYIIVLLSLFCNGMYLLFNFGNLLVPVRKWWIDICGGIQNNTGSINYTRNCIGNHVHKNKIFLYKPLFGCITCMSSIWGSVGYWVIQPFTIQALIMWPIIIVCCACGNLLINRIYE